MKKNKIVFKITALVLLTLVTMMIDKRAYAVTQQEAQKIMVDTFSKTDGFKFRNMVFDKMVTLDSVTKAKIVNTQEEFYEFIDSGMDKNTYYLIGKDTEDAYEFWWGNLGSAQLTLYKNGEISKRWGRKAFEVHDAATGKFVKWSVTDWKEEDITDNNKKSTDSGNQTVNSNNNTISKNTIINNSGTGDSPNSPLVVNGGHWTLGSNNHYHYYDKNQNEIKGKYIIDNGKVYCLDNDGMLYYGTIYTINDGNLYLTDNTGALYHNEWGYRANGWQYFGNDFHSVVNRWIYWNGNSYYLKSNGKMATDWQLIGGKWYYLNSNGVMLRNTSVGNYVLGSDGAWIK